MSTADQFIVQFMAHKPKRKRSWCLMLLSRFSKLWIYPDFIKPVKMSWSIRPCRPMLIRALLCRDLRHAAREGRLCSRSPVAANGKRSRFLRPYRTRANPRKLRRRPEQVDSGCVPLVASIWKHLSMYHSPRRKMRRPVYRHDDFLIARVAVLYRKDCLPRRIVDALIASTTLTMSQVLGALGAA